VRGHGEEGEREGEREILFCYKRGKTFLKKLRHCYKHLIQFYQMHKKLYKLMNVNTKVELRMTSFPSDAISALQSPDFSSSIFNSSIGPPTSSL